MAAQDAATAARISRLGMAMLMPEQGLAALQGVVAHKISASLSSALCAAVPFNWKQFLQRSGTQDPLFAEFYQEDAASPITILHPGNHIVTFSSFKTPLLHKLNLTWKKFGF